MSSISILVSLPYKYLCELKHAGMLQNISEADLTVGLSWVLCRWYPAALSCWYLAYLVLKYLIKTTLHWLQTLVLLICSVKQKQCSATIWALLFRSFVVLPIWYVALMYGSISKIISWAIIYRNAFVSYNCQPYFPAQEKQWVFQTLASSCPEDLVSWGEKREKNLICGSL